jgi:FkbM family methyltransferase
MNMRTLLSRTISATPLAYIPVRVQRGPAKGARWTLMPFSANWRLGGGERDVEAGLAHLSQVKGAVFWDFGAHFGIHTVGVAMQVGPEGQVAAFEPDPGAFKRLKLHVAMNGLANVRLFKAAASSRSGQSTLFAPSFLGSSVSHLRYYDSDDMRDTPRLQVASVAVDELVSSGQIRAPDLIKIDIQGHGADALAGCIESVKLKRPIIVFSNHSDRELSGTRRLLQPLGYKPWSFAGSSLTWDEVTEALLLPDHTNSRSA